MDRTAPDEPVDGSTVDTAMGTLLVRRPRGGWRDWARSYRIFVDGRRRGRIWRGGQPALPVPVGTHVVWARIDWKGSDKVDVTVRPGATVTCCVEPNGSALTAGLDITGPDHWLRLSVCD